MVKKMRRLSKRVIPYFILVSIGIAICASFFTFGLVVGEEEAISNSDLIIIVCVAAGIILLGIIYSCLYYKLSSYELTDNEIICQRGVIFKRKSILDYSRVHAVNKRQNLIQRILGLTALMVDSGSTVKVNAEIVIYLNKAEADKLYCELQNKEAKATNTISEAKDEGLKENLYKFTAKSKIAYSFVNSLLLLCILIIAGAIVGFILSNVDDLWDVKNVMLASFLTTMGAALVIYLIQLIVLIIKAFIGYYGFEIKKNDNKIEINYGLFTKIHNTFNIHKVKAIKVKQGLFQRLFKLAAIRVEVIGYNEQAGNEINVGIFIPLCRKSQVNSYLEKILPNYQLDEANSFAREFRPLISWTLIFTGVAVCLALYSALMLGLFINMDIFLYGSIGILGIAAIILLVVFINSSLEKINQGLSISNDKITVYNGGLVKGGTSILKKDLIAIEDVTTAFRAKKGIYSYIIHFHTNAISNTVKVKVLDESLRDELLSSLKY